MLAAKRPSAIPAPSETRITSLPRAFTLHQFQQLGTLIDEFRALLDVIGKS